MVSRATWTAVINLIKTKGVKKTKKTVPKPLVSKSWVNKDIIEPVKKNSTVAA
jgi:hypothetical protein